jgi:glucosamine-6-phosphate deaminase
MEIDIREDKRAASEAAADRAANILIETIDQEGKANFVVATGASQFDFLDTLTSKSGIDWSRTEMFHLDEYIGLSENHQASFRKYLRERFSEKVEIGTTHWISGDADDPQAECDRLNDLIADKEIAVSFIGIGENGHMAFNDPPADFETEEPFIIVELDKDCRQQQVNEGWFDSTEDVPKRAISMSVDQIMSSENIICTIPGERKAQAVRDCFETDEISPMKPASILKKHSQSYIYLDETSASLLNKT